MLLRTFRLIAGNPLPMELLPTVRSGYDTVHSKVLEVGGSFHDKRKILVWGTIHGGSEIHFKDSE
jgi:hypothetical protein